MKVQDMKRLIHTTALMAVGISTCLGFVSCFKDEPLNAECDIEQAYIHAGDKLNSWFLFDSDTLQYVRSDQNKIEFTMSAMADLTQIAPLFRLTPGATISPANGSVHDFSKGSVKYTVTSEDGQWSRIYFVSIRKMLYFGSEHEFNFENCYEDKGYYHWQEPWKDANGKTTKEAIWATGNPGYKISNSSTAAENYPTAPIDEGYEGKGVKLSTCRTSGLADMVQKPIAAGNLFIGQFDPSNALQDAMSATKFGRPFSFDTQPKTFTGYYKYKAGEKFTDQYMHVLEQKDYGTIYAVFYDNHNAKGEAVVLYGNNVQTSEQVVALARLDNIDNTPEWTPFTLNFIYRKAVDMQKLKAGGYSLAIVCSSSTNGAEFMGAVGSTLWVDKFKITCE